MEEELRYYQSIYESQTSLFEKLQKEGSYLLLLQKVQEEIQALNHVISSIESDIKRAKLNRS